MVYLEALGFLLPEQAYYIYLQLFVPVEIALTIVFVVIDLEQCSLLLK
jgi:hypothetical protein